MRHADTEHCWGSGVFGFAYGSASSGLMVEPGKSGRKIAERSSGDE